MVFLPSFSTSIQTYIWCQQIKRRDRILVSAQQGEDAQIQSIDLEIPGAAAVTSGGSSLRGLLPHEWLDDLQLLFSEKEHALYGSISVQSALHSIRALGDSSPGNSSTDSSLFSDDVMLFSLAL